MARGKLIITKPEHSKSPRIQVKIGDKLFDIKKGEVSQTILHRLNSMNGVDVDLDRRATENSAIPAKMTEYLLCGIEKTGNALKE